ncbi:MAG: TIR domain-containing protein [Methanobacteriaceae archaeon]|nr:MAG: hypothetical protein CIT01_10520 [Methanobacterium sp. BRmetb2]MCC7557681.1 TIR domain-containing protein [Methanobacteriaceae archaeon]
MWEEESRVYKIYISHIEDFKEYNIFLDKLNAANEFEWINLAKPGDGNENLELQIKDVDVVIILSGQYSKNPSSVEKQIKIAQKFKKPLIVVRPYGMENVPTFIENLAQDIVGWNTPCIIEVIKENALEN